MDEAYRNSTVIFQITRKREDQEGQWITRQVAYGGVPLRLLSYEEEWPIAKETRDGMQRCLHKLGSPQMKRLRGSTSQMMTTDKLRLAATYANRCISSDVLEAISCAEAGRLVVVTDDTSVPWELVLEADAGESRLEDRLWGWRYALARVIVPPRKTVGSLAPLEFVDELRVLLVLCPTEDLESWDRDRQERLGNTVEEELKRVFDPVHPIATTVLKYEQATKDRLTAEVSKQHPHIIYYFGHLVDAGQQRVFALRDGNATLADLAIGRDALIDSMPLLFVNACSSAVDPSADSGATQGNLPMAFLDAGAPAYLGTFWDVDPETAHRLAVSLFYHLTLRMETIADSLFKAKADTRVWLDWNRRMSVQDFLKDAATCPDWAAYALYGSGSTFVRLFRVPKVELHYGQPSLHHLYNLKSAPGGYVGELVPHPLGGVVVPYPEEEGTVHVTADIVSTLAEQKARLREHGMVIFGGLFYSMARDDGILVAERGSMLPKTIEDIKDASERFSLLVLSPRFFGADWCERSLAAKGVDNVDFAYISEVSAYPELLVRGTYDGAFLFGALFHSSRLRRSGDLPVLEEPGVTDLRVLEGSSINEFYHSESGTYFVPVVLVASKKEIERNRLLFQDLLLRIRESMCEFFDNPQHDPSISRLMGVGIETLQALRRTQAPSPVTFSHEDLRGHPLFADLGVGDLLHEVPIIERCEVLPQRQPLDLDHEETRCPCLECQRKRGIEDPQVDETLQEAVILERDYIDMCGYSDSLGDWVSATIIFVDMVGLKDVNDLYDHDTGDAAIESMAWALLRGIGDRGSLYGQKGGDEYVILLPGVCEQEASELMEQVRKDLSSGPLVLAGRELDVTVSFSYGVCDYPAMTTDPGRLVGMAEDLMYQDKAGFYHKRGCNHLAKGEYAEAQADLARAMRYIRERDVAERPVLADIGLGLALAHVLVGNDKEAGRQLTGVVATCPQCEDGQEALEMLESGQLQQAEAILKRAACLPEIAPDDHG